LTLLDDLELTLRVQTKAARLKQVEKFFFTDVFAIQMVVLSVSGGVV
jgi:hypothetical protein